MEDNTINSQVSNTLSADEMSDQSEQIDNCFSCDSASKINDKKDFDHNDDRKNDLKTNSKSSDDSLTNLGSASDSCELSNELNNLHNIKNDVVTFGLENDPVSVSNPKESNSSTKADVYSNSIGNDETDVETNKSAATLLNETTPSRGEYLKPSDTNHLSDTLTSNTRQNHQELTMNCAGTDLIKSESSAAIIDDPGSHTAVKPFNPGITTFETSRTHSHFVNELLDDLSDFFGFDDASILDTRKKLTLLTEKRDELTWLIENERLKANSLNNAAVCSENTTGEAVISVDGANISSCILSSSSRSSSNYVYQLAKDVNIFQEQVPSGSKRQKKRRKFFDDVTGQDTKSIHKKLNVVPKQQAEHNLSLDSSSNLSTNVAENKENFANDQRDRIAFESMLLQNSSSVDSYSETTATTMTPTTAAAAAIKSPVSTPKTGSKPKGFDISNPLYKEPFKFGWTREIVFRELPEGKKGKPAYVTYFDCDMKKFKTIRHIVESLPTDSPLGAHHFTFSKERIFDANEPSGFEIVRYMKYVSKDANSSTDLIKLTDEVSRLNSAFPLIRPAQLQEPKKKKIVTLERGPGGRWISANTGSNTTGFSNQNIVSSNNQLELKPKSYKKAKLKTNDDDNLWSELSSSSSSIGCSKPSMPKILIRGVGVSPNSNLKMTNPKLKYVSTVRPAGIVQKKTFAANKKTFASVDGEDFLPHERESDTLSDFSYIAANCSSPNFSSISTGQTSNFNGGERTLKRRYSGADDSEEWTEHAAKIKRFESSTVAYRSSLTLSNISCLFDPLVLCFKYLTVKELLRVSITCKYLNVLASDSRLWSTVRLKNSKVTNWDGFAAALRKHSTKRLDMRKMLCPTGADDLAAMWKDFERIIPQVDTLQHIDFMRCPSSVLHTVTNYCPNLRVINALQLSKNSDLSVECFSRCKCLRELRLKGFPFVNLEPNAVSFKFLNVDSLRVLSITNARDIQQNTLDAISELENLRVLELGDCESLPNTFTDVLVNMKKLERLRLEKVVNLDPEYRIFSTLRNLPRFEVLELINFEVKIGFDKALSQCENLRELLLIPLYRTQSATANRLIMDGVKTISNTLKKFAWALTNELLKVTDLFLQEYHSSSKSQDGQNAAVKDEAASVANNGTKMPLVNSKDAIQQHTNYCIPIIRKSDDENPDSSVEIEVIAISKLESQVVAMLPNTKVRILKVPFNSANRHSLLECFK